MPDNQVESGEGGEGGSNDGPLPLTLENVEKTLDEMRPYLMSDGGNVRVRRSTKRRKCKITHTRGSNQHTAHRSTTRSLAEPCALCTPCPRLSLSRGAGAGV